jgi:hypothetical protein
LRRSSSSTSSSLSTVRSRRGDAARCGVCGRRAPGLRPRGREAALAGTRSRDEERRSSRGRRLESSVGGTASWSLVPPGRGTAAAVPGRSSSRRRGSRHTARRRRGLSVDADQLVRASAGSSSGSPRRLSALGGATRSRGYAGSGSTSSPSAKQRRYIVDHDTGRLVWAAEGRDKQTVPAFFDQLGAVRAARIDLVSSDLGEPIARAVKERSRELTTVPRPVSPRRVRQQRPGRVRRETSGSRHAAPATRPPPACSKAPAGPPVETTRATDRPSARRSWPRSSTSTAASTAPTCSQSSRGSSSTATPTTPARCSTPGWPGHAAAASRASSSSPRRSPRTRPGSPPRPTLERPHRSDQHDATADHPPRLRLPLRPGADRARTAHSRRPPPGTTRPSISTHGNVRSSL